MMSFLLPIRARLMARTNGAKTKDGENMSDFRALVIDRKDGAQGVSLKTLSDRDLMDGDVTVRVSHSTVNYKDGLAISGKAPVVRRFPMIPGIDLAGVVESSSHPDYKPGDSV